jgi:integrase
MRLQEANPQTVVKELSVLRNAFNVAIREWEWCKDNPVSRVSMPKLPQGRARHLNSQDIKNLIDNAESWFKPILVVAVLTGMRLGNIMSLLWDEVDMSKKVIVLEKTKNGKRLAIPINDTLLETFKNLNKVRLLNCKQVFHRNGKPLYQKQVERALKRACKKAGIKDFRFHDLRHTFASLLIQSGEDFYTVQKLLGHRDGRMTQRYAHLSQEGLSSATKKLDRICHSSVIVDDKKKGKKAVNP